MRHLRRPRAAAMAITIAAFLAAIVAVSRGTATGVSLSIFALGGVAYLVVGVLIIERRSGNAVGPILFVLGAIVAFYVVADTLVRLPETGATAAYSALAVTLLDAPLFTLVAWLFLLFPDGRPLAGAWRWIGVAAVGFGLASMVGTALAAGPFPFYPWLVNPIGLAGSWITDVASVFYVATILLIGLSALSLIKRWRHGGPIERAQLKWVATAAALIAAVMVAYAITFGPGQFNDMFDLAVGVALSLLPIAVGIAILRYRLFQIDRIVSRTIAYVVITTLLIGTYGSIVLVLQGPLSTFTGGDTIAVALSTLAAASLFQPLRRGVQAMVDRRFDRARIDADRTTRAFAERLRAETDMAAVTVDLDATVRDAVRPATAGLWLRKATR